MGDDDGKDPKGKAKKKEPKPPGLNDDAPDEVKDFVDCKTDSITLDPVVKGLIPSIPGMKKLDVKVEAGAKEGTAKVTISNGKGENDINATFTVGVKGGHLDVDTTGVTPQLVKDEIDKWVRKYNRWLDHKKRKLDGLTVDGGKVTIKKVAQTGAYLPSDGGAWGTGTRVAVGLGGALLLAGGIYVSAQVVGEDGAGQTDTVSAAAPADQAGGGGDPLTGYTCEPTLTCAQFDAFLQGVGTAISHDGSPAAPDALSDADWVGVTRGIDLVSLIADCAGRTTTSEGTPDADGVVHVHIPLYQYGHCEIADFEIKLRDGTTFSDGLPVSAADVTSWDVTETPTTVNEADIDALLQTLRPLEETAPDWAGVLERITGDPDLCPINTLLSDAGARPGFSTLCPGGSPLTGLQFWDDPDASGAYGVGGVNVAGLDAVTWEAIFGPDGDFPCGRGTYGFTICPDDPTHPAGATSMTVFQIAYPGDTARPVTIDLPGGDQVTVTPDGAESSVSATGEVTQPWAIIRNATITIALPGAPLDSIQVEGGPEVTLDPTVTLGRAGGGGGTPQPDRQALVDQFVSRLAASLASSDRSFALQHLDPLVTEVFPTQCPAHFERFDDPTYAIRVVRVGATGPYQYAPPSLGGQSFTAQGVLTVTADLTQDGRTARADLHFGEHDGQLTWFADCGR